MLRILLGIFLVLLLVAPVSAMKIYQLQGNQFAIICDDGIGYSFSGSASGAQEAGALLCKDHGGIVNIIGTRPANQLLREMEMDRKRPGGTLNNQKGASAY